MKDDLSQKKNNNNNNKKENTWKYHILFKRPEKMVFPKKIVPEYDLLYHQKRWHFFFPKI